MLTGKDIVKITALATGAFVLKSTFSRFFEYDLRNKTVLITGGSRGLGLVMAREFAREGARLFLCARDEQELQQAKSDVEDFGAEVMNVTCDITDRQAVNEMIAAVHAPFCT